MLLGIGLKLLGVRKIITEFFSNNWKWLVPLILVVSISALGYFKYKSDMEESYNSGYAKAVVVTNDAWNNKILEESKKNKEFENTLRDIIENFGQNAVKEAAKRIGKETILTNRIQTLVKDNPIYKDCVVGDDVIDSRNKIRALGPTPYPIRLEIGE